jgi:hypothetical protein
MKDELDFAIWQFLSLSHENYDLIKKESMAFSTYSMGDVIPYK